MYDDDPEGHRVMRLTPPPRKIAHLSEINLQTIDFHENTQKRLRIFAMFELMTKDATLRLYHCTTMKLVAHIERNQ